MSSHSGNIISPPPLRVDRTANGGVCVLTLCRPHRGNALAADTVEALISAMTQAHTEPQTHTVLLRAEGPHFCTGLDLSQLDNLSDEILAFRLIRIETLLSLLWHSPLATVVQAQGRAWGAGADLFAVCEQRQAWADASFRFPGAQFGVVLGTRRLAERMGVDAARRLVLHGGTLDVTAAQRLGLVTDVLSDQAKTPPLSVPVVAPDTARAIRAASRSEQQRDADLAALVRSVTEPGLKQRVLAYRQRQLEQRQQAD